MPETDIKAEVKPEADVGEMVEKYESMKDTYRDDGSSIITSQTIRSICNTLQTNMYSSTPALPNDRVFNMDALASVPSEVATNLDHTEIAFSIPPTHPQPAELLMDVTTEEAEPKSEMEQTEIKTGEFESKSEVETAEMKTEDSDDSADSTATLIVTPTRKSNPDRSKAVRRKRGYVEDLHSVVRRIICRICMTPVPSLQKLIVHLDRQHNIQVQGPAHIVDSENRDDSEDTKNLSNLLQSMENKPRVVDPLSDSSESESEDESSEEEAENSEMSQCDMEASRELRWKQMMLQELAKLDVEKIRKTLELRCTLCFVEFPHRYLLHYHIDLHIQGLLHTCPHCRMAFLHEYHLSVHLSSLKVDIPLLEEVQDIPQESEMTLDSEFPYPVHQCPDCPSIFANRRCLLFHRTGHDGFHRCPQCEKPFLRYPILLKHIHSAHNKELRRITCLVPGCRRTFQSSKGLAVHTNRFHKTQYNAKPNLTRSTQPKRVSGTSFRSGRRTKFNWYRQKVKPKPSFQTLQPRLQLPSQGPGPEGWLRLKCSYCPLRFKKAETQSNHLLTVHGVNLKWKKPFVCYLCRTGVDQETIAAAPCPPASAFIQSASLVRHITKYHSQYTLAQMLTFRPDLKEVEVEEEEIEGDKEENCYDQLKCSFCNMRFNTHKTQRDHLLSEHGIDLEWKKPFVCYLCLSGTDQQKVTTALYPISHDFTSASPLVRHVAKYHPHYTLLQMLSFRPASETMEKKGETVTDGSQESMEWSLKLKCPYCPLRFKERGDQSSHLRGVHMINLNRKKPFVCYLCKSGTDQEIAGKVLSVIHVEFATISPFTSHMRKYHPKFTPVQMLTFRPEVEEPESVEEEEDEVDEEMEDQEEDEEVEEDQENEEEVESAKEEEQEPSLIIEGKRSRVPVQKYHVTSDESEYESTESSDSNDHEDFLALQTKPGSTGGLRKCTQKLKGYTDKGKKKKVKGKRWKSKGQEQLTCPYCPAHKLLAYGCNYSLNRHIRHHHANVLKSDPSSSKKTEHMLRCSYCPQVFPNGKPVSLNLHIFHKHPEKPKPKETLTCPMCNKSLSSRRCLNDHTARCRGIIPRPMRTKDDPVTQEGSPSSKDEAEVVKETPAKVVKLEVVVVEEKIEEQSDPVKGEVKEESEPILTREMRIRRPAQRYQYQEVESDDSLELEGRALDTKVPVTTDGSSDPSSSRATRATTSALSRSTSKAEAVKGTGQTKMQTHKGIGRSKDYGKLSKNGVVKGVECPYCTVWFCRGDTLRTHIRTEHSNILETDPTAAMKTAHMLRCPLCPAVFPSGKSQSVHSHMTFSHPEYKQPGLVCPGCQMQLRSTRELKDHMASCPHRTDNKRNTNESVVGVASNTSKDDAIGTKMESKPVSNEVDKSECEDIPSEAAEAIRRREDSDFPDQSGPVLDVGNVSKDEEVDAESTQSVVTFDTALEAQMSKVGVTKDGQLEEFGSQGLEIELDVVEDKPSAVETLTRQKMEIIPDSTEKSPYGDNTIEGTSQEWGLLEQLLQDHNQTLPQSQKCGQMATNPSPVALSIIPQTECFTLYYPQSESESEAKEESTLDATDLIVVEEQTAPETEFEDMEREAMELDHFDLSEVQEILGEQNIRVPFF